MKTLDVEEILKSDEMTRMIPGGVYAVDQLPRTITHRHLLYIANTDPYFKPGHHWLSQYFDPLGKEPNNIIEDYLTQMGPSGNLRNVKRVQGASVNCGQFCL